MALEKIEGVDKIVIGYPYMVLKIRRATTILDDGKKVTSMFAHDELYPGKLDDNDALVDTDTSGTGVYIVLLLIYQGKENKKV